MPARDRQRRRGAADRAGRGAPPSAAGPPRDGDRRHGRVTSSAGDAPELAQLEAALADAAAGQPSLAFVVGESGVGKTGSWPSSRARAEAGGARVLRGDCVQLGEGELAYAPLVSALRPLARDADPVLTGLGPEVLAELATLLPGIAAAREQGVRPGEQARVFEALLAVFDGLARERRAAGDRGPALGRRVHARVPALPRRRARRTSRCWSWPPTAPTSCTAAIRCGRCSPSSSARARCAIDLAGFTRDGAREQLADILGAEPEPRSSSGCTRAAEGNPLFTEELLAAGARRPRRACRRAWPRARAADRAARRPTRRRSSACSRPAGGSTTRARRGRRPRAARAARRAARGGRGPHRRARAATATRSATRCCARRPRRPAAGRARRAAPRARARRSRPGAGPLDNARRRRDRPPLPRGRRPAGGAGGGGTRGARGDGGPGLPRGRPALFERALELWDRVPDAPELAGPTRSSCSSAPPPATSTPTTPALGHVARRALALVDEAAEPRRAAGCTGCCTAALWALLRQEEALAALDRGLALLADDVPSPERAGLLARHARRR